MSDVFLFVPFPEDCIFFSDCSKNKHPWDPFIGATICDFTRNGNRDDHIVYSCVNQNWSPQKPQSGRSDSFDIFHKENQKARDAFTSDSSVKRGPTFFCTRLTDISKAGRLSGVSKDDMLFIVGHSSYDSGWLCLKMSVISEVDYSVTEYYFKIGMDHLAQLLELEGLCKSHRHIKLHSCYGGGSEEFDYAVARDLAKALKGRGYLNLTVGGYRYLVSPKGGEGFHLKAPMEEDHTISLKPVTSERVVKIFARENNPSTEELMYATDPYRCWYNGDGECIRWNVPEGYYDQNLVPLIDKRDKHYKEYRARKRAEAEWIKAMARVNKRSHKK
jgi:hypothetical protein